MAPVGYKVPRKKLPKRSNSNGTYTAVWEYLETIPEYESLKSLLELLVARFGAAHTPSTTYLNRHLTINRGNRNGNNQKNP